MVLLFELSDVIEHFIQHKSAQSKVLGHTLQIAIDRSDNQHNSAGILLPWSTTKGATYMLSVSVELLEGDRAFIFGETADYQMRLIPRNYWVYPNQPLNQDILFQAQSETTVLGVLFNQKGLNYKALLTKFTLNQTRTHPETPIPEKIALPSLKNPDKKRLKSIRTQVTPSPYQIPIVNFGKPTVKRDEVPSSVAQKTSLDFFNPNYQPKSSAPTGQILIKRYPPWFNQSQSLLSGLVDQIYLIKWDHEEDWMDLQFKRLNLEYFLVYSVEKDDTTYQKLAQTKPPSFSLNHPDAQSYAQTQTYYQLLKHISRKRLKKVLIMDTNLLFKADFETQLKKIIQQRALEKFSAFYLNVAPDTPLTPLQINKTNQVPFYLLEMGQINVTNALILEHNLIAKILNGWEASSTLNFWQLVHNLSLKTDGAIVAYPNLVKTRDNQDFKKWIHSYADRSIRQLLYDQPKLMTIEAIKQYVPENLFELLAIKPNQRVNKYHLICLMECRSPALAVIVPSYNNRQNYQKNLASIFAQRYNNYRVIYVDDCSTDQTADLVNEFIKKNKYEGRCQVLRQINNQKQGASRYLAYHRVDPDEILILLDGDDWLAHEDVFKTVADVYQKRQLWLTYGSFYKHVGQKTNWSNLSGTGTFPTRVIERKLYRKFRWTSQHLRTGLAFLFQAIKIEHLWDQKGRFLHTCTDLAESFPTIEMAGNRHQNLNQGLYVYNQDNSLQYQNSFYNMNKKDNKTAKIYHDLVVKNLKRVEPYATKSPNDRYHHYHDELLCLNLIVTTSIWQKIRQNKTNNWHLIEPIYLSNLNLKSASKNTLKENHVYLTDSFKAEEVRLINPKNQWTLVLKDLADLAKLDLALKWLAKTQGDLFYFQTTTLPENFIYNLVTARADPVTIAVCLNQQPVKPNFKGSKLYRTHSLQQNQYKIGLFFLPKLNA